MAVTVLIVDDSPTIRAAMSLAVQAMKLEPLVAESGERALELFIATPPALVLLDVMMPGIDGYETARRMRAALPDAWVPIIFLSSSEFDQDLERAIESGGDDYLVKPVSPVVLSAKIRALQRLDRMQKKLLEMSQELADANGRLQNLSQQDGLTGIANRRAFDQQLGIHAADAARRSEPLALVLCDVDHFKSFNDYYGHPAGDECLKQFAAALMRNCHRPGDCAARYGGEEFALLLPNTGLEGARTVVEAIRRDMSALALPHGASPTAPIVTFSAGIAALVPQAADDAERLVRQADQALYRAKQAGRNRSVLATPA